MPSYTGFIEILGLTVYMKLAINLNPLSSSTIKDWSYTVDHLPVIGAPQDTGLEQILAWT